MSFTQLQQSLANIEIWKKDLKEDQTPNSTTELFDWMKGQLLHNLAPLLESHAKASMEELGEVFEVLEGQEKAIEELVDQEGDFLQPEMASDLTATLMIGMFIVNTLNSEGVKLENELMNKKLQDAAKMYQQNSIILLEQIKEVTVEDDEEEDSNDNDNGTDTNDDIIHGEGEGAGNGDGSADGGSRAGDGDGRESGDSGGEDDAATPTTGSEGA